MLQLTQSKHVDVLTKLKRWSTVQQCQVFTAQDLLEHSHRNVSEDEAIAQVLGKLYTPKTTYRDMNRYQHGLRQRSDLNKW